MKKHAAKIGLIIWWIFIFLLTSIPGKDLPKVDIKDIDKLIHFIMYGGLGFWLSLFLGLRGVRGIKLFITVVIIAFAYSIIDELHQPPLGRNFSVYDIIADIIGLLITTVPMVLLFSRKKYNAN